MKILVYKFIIIIIFVIFTRIDSFSDQAYLNDFVLSYQNYSKYILLNSTTSIFIHLEIALKLVGNLLFDNLEVCKC